MPPALEYTLPHGFNNLSLRDACMFACRAAFLLKRRPRQGRHECVEWVLRARGLEPGAPNVSDRRWAEIMASVNSSNNQMRRSLIIHMWEAIAAWFATNDGAAYNTAQPFVPAGGAARNDAMSDVERLQLAVFLKRRVIVARIWRQALDYFNPEFINAWQHQIFAALTRVITYMARPLFLLIRANGLAPNERRYRFPDAIYRRLNTADRFTEEVILPVGAAGCSCYNTMFPGLGSSQRRYQWLEELEEAEEIELGRSDTILTLASWQTAPLSAE